MCGPTRPRATDCGYDDNLLRGDRRNGCRTCTKRVLSCSDQLLRPLMIFSLGEVEMAPQSQWCAQVYAQVVIIACGLLMACPGQAIEGRTPLPPPVTLGAIISPG
jgi:hypothetical protein